MITIVTDSTAYLTKGQAHKLGVSLVPVNFTIDGKSFSESFADQKGRYEALVGEHIFQCTTAHPPISTFLAAFEKELAAGNEVLCIVMSSRLSGTYSSATLAAQELNDQRIAVVDSLSTAGGQYLLVQKARELIDAGMGLHETAARLEEIKKQVGTAFSVDNMDALRRSGRLGLVRQSVSAILNIRPLLTLKDGAIVADGMARGRTEQIKALIAKVPPQAGRVVVEYFGPGVEPKKITAVLKQAGVGADITVSRIGPVLGIHLGLGVVGLAWLCD